jgi:UDP-N-acetylmuramoyl-tripeptide--D-alanyl-D-alanine ligase
VTDCGADLLLAMGTHRYHLVDGARTAGMPVAQAIACEDAEDVVSTLRQIVRPGDVVLIKGSQVTSMQRIVQALEWQPQRRAA